MAIENYDEQPVMYRAELIDGSLILTEINAHIYNRIGTAGLGSTPMKAIYELRKRTMVQFESDMSKISWQSREYGDDLA